MDLLAATSSLATRLDALPVPRGVGAVLNPLSYAWGAHRRWLLRFTDPVYEEEPVVVGRTAQPRRVLVIGMNPGPHGMVQTGLPFGDVVTARRILRLPDDFAERAGEGPLEGMLVAATPNRSLAGMQFNGHMVRKVNGFAHSRVEESGRRLWSALSDLWGDLDALLADAFVMNLVPLAFFAADGANVTPDELDPRDREPVLAACREYLVAVVRAMRPRHVVCVSRWVERTVASMLTVGTASFADGTRERMVLGDPEHGPPTLHYLPHPSPRGQTDAGAWARSAAQALAPVLAGRAS